MHYVRRVALLSSVLFAAVAFAKSKDEIAAEHCEKIKTDLQAKKCPDEAAKAKDASCKNTDDLNAMTKLLGECVKSIMHPKDAGTK